MLTLGRSNRVVLVLAACGVYLLLSPTHNRSPVCVSGPEPLPCLGPILPPSRKSVAPRRARNFRAGARCAPACRSQPFRVSAGRNRSNSSPRGQTACLAFLCLCLAFLQFLPRNFQPTKKGVDHDKRPPQQDRSLRPITFNLHFALRRLGGKSTRLKLLFLHRPARRTVAIKTL